jgi:hypothetical protein
MATDAEYRRILAPVMNLHPDWLYHRRWIICRPIGFYLRGCIFKASFYSRQDCQVLHCVDPLFESPFGKHITWGSNCPRPGTSNRGWEIFHPDFTTQVLELMATTIVPKTAHVHDGESFIDYLDGHQVRGDWGDWPRALGNIHLGNLEEAHRLIAPLAKLMRREVPHLHEPGIWGHSMLEMLRLIEEDPAAIPAHCEAVARQAVKANKLERFWEPVPFRYGNRPIP